ncbi:hypothetical protein NQ318_007806 [Aromia moschata]|uniref:ZAD domain-containing protein n=1 Tax=Aromia moschata TaxID=1265417 RepID=A0AAV8Z0B3_9CUCU|nr:hypothetical protein NQ318_007806 [Aromia moschata]
MSKNISTMNDNLPNMICSDCVSKLTDVYKFKIQCENSDLMFKQHLGDKTILETRKKEAFIKEEFNDCHINNGNTQDERCLHDAEDARGIKKEYRKKSIG